MVFRRCGVRISAIYWAALFPANGIFLVDCAMDETAHVQQLEWISTVLDDVWDVDFSLHPDFSDCSRDYSDRPTVIPNIIS